jgi:hypothetical protein
MSFAVSRGFGATHPLIALADRLHDQHRISLGALTTFYEAEAEDAEDREKLEMAWQPADSLQGELKRVIAACESDPLCQTLVRRGDAESLVPEAKALAVLLNSPVSNGTRVRLVYAL